MAAFIGPMEEKLDGVFPGGCGYGRELLLMKPEKFLRRPNQSYNVTVGGKKVRVGVLKKCFIIRKSPPPWRDVGTG